MITLFERESYANPQYFSGQNEGLDFGVMGAEDGMS